MKYRDLALVFSGGGARGAYQIGVWQAMIELGIVSNIRSVFGTSVGAINGAAFVQDDIDLAIDIWRHIEYKNVFANISEELENLKARRRYYKWIKGAIKNRGMDVSPLKENLREHLDENIIRKSNRNYGLVAFDLKKRKAEYLRKEDIPKGKLIEYVIASATFPTFQPHRIDDQVFMDGGIIDNRPLSFLSEANHIDLVICIDVTIARHFWKGKKTGGHHKVLYVRPSKLLGSPLAFRPTKILRNMELGYEDGLRQLRTLR